MSAFVKMISPYQKKITKCIHLVESNDSVESSVAMVVLRRPDGGDVTWRGDPTEAGKPSTLFTLTIIAALGDLGGIDLLASACGSM